MAALMRSFAWERTSLGPASGWSPALRTVVATVLRSPRPMAVCWGPRFAQLYNDAYRPILGAKHPASLGQPASECWPEIWEALGPMLETSFAGRPGGSSLDLCLLVDRKGFLEEAHFDVACGPVPDEAVPSGVGGVLADVFETTGQVQRERQLRTLRQLASSAADTRSAERACEAAALTLSENPSDIAFALIYLVDEAAGVVRLAASVPSGMEGGPGAPGNVDLRRGDAAGWPIADVLRSRRPAVISDLLVRFGALPGGRWPEPPTAALALPLSAPGDPQPRGVLVAGASPHRELDEGYRSFLGLAAALIGASVASARERQAERRRADRLAEIDRAQAELRRLEEEHRVTEAARERLAETLRMNELFVAVLGHDLRTPLSAISLGTAILLKRSALRPDDAKAVARIASSADRIARMIGQVLDLTRSRLGGGIPVQLARVDLHEVARKVLDELKLAHPEASLQLQLQGDAWGEWDPDRLAQAISNLGGNAVQHGAQAPVTVAVAGAPDSVSISVHNTGPPIPAEAMASIFDAFRAGTRSPGGSAGLGLGLYITREIVRAHGGSILVRSSEGKGTTFTAILPRRAGDRASAGETSVATAAHEPAPRPQG
jgi:signal transduction histidine kinase